MDKQDEFVIMIIHDLYSGDLNAFGASVKLSRLLLLISLWKLRLLRTETLSLRFVQDIARHTLIVFNHMPNSVAGMNM